MGRGEGREVREGREGRGRDNMLRWGLNLIKLVLIPSILEESLPRAPFGAHSFDMTLLKQDGPPCVWHASGLVGGGATPKRV